MAKRIEIEGFGLLENLLEGLVGEFGQDTPREKQKIGKVREEIRLAYLDWQEKKEQFDMEVDRKKEQLERQMQRELANHFEDKFHDLVHEKEVLWGAIKRDLGITDDEEKELNINPKTGVISEWV